MNKGFTIIILLLICSIEVFLDLSVYEPSFDDLKMMGTLGLIQFVLSIYSSIRNGQRLFSPYIVFLTVLYIFHVGQSLMYPFGIISHNDLIGFFGITVSDIFRSQTISLTFLAFFQIGALLTSQNSRKFAVSEIKSKYMERRLIQIGFFFAIISAYFYYDELIGNAIKSMLFGYGSLYEGEAKIGFSNIGSILGDYFTPAIICLFIGYRKKKVARNIIIGIFLFNAAVTLVTGGRSEAVIMIALILVMRNYMVARFTKKDMAVIAGGAFCLLLLLASVGRMRSSDRRDFTDTFSISDNNSNAATDAIGEMGGSMFCTIWTKEIVDHTQDYRLGSSYLFAITSIIPNVGFWDIHPAQKYADLNAWLTKEKRLGFGTGFSMVAEAYVNFGRFGCLMMLLLGYCFAKFFNNMEPAIRGRNLAYVAFVMVFFWFSLKIPRNSFIGVIRAIVYYALPVYWYSRGYILKKFKI